MSYINILIIVCIIFFSYQLIDQNEYFNLHRELYRDIKPSSKKSDPTECEYKCFQADKRPEVLTSTPSKYATEECQSLCRE